MRYTKLPAVGALIVSIGVGLSTAAVEFVALGDLPYNDAQAEILSDAIVPAIRDADVPFVVHYGDFKSGGAACTDEIFAAGHATIGALHDGPLFFTPGDNDWTDCDRETDVAGMSELERLDHLRRVFYVTPEATPPAWQTRRQPLYPENATWTVDDVVFVTAHVVGTNNGRDEIMKDDIENALAQVNAREHATRAWLTEAALATLRAKALVVISHADPTTPFGAGSCDAMNRMKCDAFADFRALLRRAAEIHGKPMLYVHGDTSPFCLDETFGDGADNLWRLNGPGDYTVIDAVKVSVEPAADTPFVVSSLVGGAAPPGCN